MWITVSIGQWLCRKFVMRVCIHINVITNLEYAVEREGAGRPLEEDMTDERPASCRAESIYYIFAHLNIRTDNTQTVRAEDASDIPESAFEIKV
ncbi:unnamed protein product [Gongylonema pulchrum]|uniref:Uncharacterized protein n=1 Tax=Gongylonema pulchrum TaxID=637853 RepID=A0A183EK61_9BILA|nr:unnamed protein product [Gongylonema pulchrum]